MSGFASTSNQYQVNAPNATGVAIGERAQVIQNIAAVYHIHQAAQGQLHITAKLRSDLDAVFQHHNLFGGRDVELSQINTFVNEGTNGYFFVTGRSGFGKSALLANWIKVRQASGQPVCYHFINRSERVADEHFAMLNLCQQLTAYHELSGTLPVATEELRALYVQLLSIPPASSEKLVVVLDGLDEATGWEPRATLFPRDLPEGVFIIFSARTMADRVWLVDLKLPLPAQQIMTLTTLGLAELAQLLQTTIGAEAKWVTQPDAVQVALDKSHGDPFYLHYLIQDIRQGKIQSREQLAKQPSELNDYLDQWWIEVRKSAKEDAVRDLLGYLLVARGPLTRTDLSQVSDEDALDDWRIDEAIEQVRRYLVGDDESGYLFSHPRFQDYVTQKRVGEAAQHPYRQRLLDYCGHWQQHRSGYALTYYAQHLAEAAQNSKQPGRHQLTDRLVKLVADPDFQEAHKDTVNDLAALQRDVERALQVAAEDQSAEDVTRSLPLVIQSALELVNFRKRELRPEPIFQLAIMGNIVAAVQRLRLFNLDADWQQAIPLIIAWLALNSNPDEERKNVARKLREDIQVDISKPDPLKPGPLQILAARLDAMLVGQSQPQYQLPPPLSDEEARMRVAHLGGPMGSATELLNRRLKTEQIGDAGPLFLAEQDAPGLVAYAAQVPETGNQLFQEYLALHTSYFYPEYRRGSMWYILQATLQHPNSAWIQSVLPAIATAAISGSSIEFQECLALTLRALRALAGATDAMQDLETRHGQMVAAANHLSWESAQGDALAFHMRRLIGMAQVLTRLLGRENEAIQLLTQTIQLPYGFAGFRSPACLALAEAYYICQPHHPYRNVALDEAQSAAHHIHDLTFRLRSTARVTAMRTRWWSSASVNVTTVINRLRDDRNTAEFACLHRVGSDQLSPPTELRQANTLRILAALYKRSLTEFQRLNPQWQPDQMIMDGEDVHVPDPGFATQLAPRLASEALVASGLTDHERVELIQLLVPIAAASPTALDTVLSRLLLAACPTDPAILKTLDAVSATAVWEPTDPLATMITASIP